MKNVNDVVLTDEIRAPYHARWIRDDKNIRIMEYIKAQSTKRLKSLIKYTSAGNISYGHAGLKKFIAELSPTGSYLNVGTIVSDIASNLYERDVWDDEQYIRYQQENH